MSKNADESDMPRSGAFMTEVDAQEETQVLRVEDETFRFFENAADQRLPRQTRWAIVAEDVAESMGIPEGKMLRQWRSYFNSEACSAMNDRITPNRCSSITPTGRFRTGSRHG